MVAALPIVFVGVSGLSPLVRALPLEFEGIGPRLTGTVVGLVFAVDEIGGFLGPALVGPLREPTGTYAAGIALFSCGGVLVVAAGAAMDL